MTHGAVDASSSHVWQHKPHDVGVSAHRGDQHVAPENTIPAVELAVQKGAHQIEFDVRLSKDGQLAIMHDSTVDRTTNGTGPLGSFTLEELRQLDAGSWKGPEWKGTQIPTFREVLQAVPTHIQLNCHLHHYPGIAAQTVQQIVDMERLDQCFLACDIAQAQEAKSVESSIRICNMERQGPPDSSYPQLTIDLGAEFIQLVGWHDSMAEVCRNLKAHNITINYCCTEDPAFFRQLLEAGVQYPLTDTLDDMLAVLKDMGIPPAGE